VEKEPLIPAMILTRGNKIAYSWTNQEKGGRGDRTRGKGILKKTMNLVGSSARLIVKIYRRRRVESDRSKGSDRAARKIKESYREAR